MYRHVLITSMPDLALLDSLSLDDSFVEHGACVLTRSAANERQRRPSFDMSCRCPQRTSTTQAYL